MSDSPDSRDWNPCTPQEFETTCPKCRRKLTVTAHADHRGLLGKPTLFQCPGCDEHYFITQDSQSRKLKCQNTRNHRHPDHHFSIQVTLFGSETEARKLERERLKRTRRTETISKASQSVLKPFREDRKQVAQLLQALNQKMRRCLLDKDTSDLFSRGIEFLMDCARKPELALQHLAERLLRPLDNEKRGELNRLMEREEMPVDDVTMQLLAPKQMSLNEVIAATLAPLRFDSVEHPWMKKSEPNRRDDLSDQRNWCQARKFLLDEGMSAAWHPRNVAKLLDDVEGLLRQQGKWSASGDWRTSCEVKGERGVFDVPRLWLENVLTHWRNKQKKGGGRSRTAM